MKKIVLIVMALILVLPLAACSTKKQVPKVDKQTTLLQKNQKKWQQQIADLQVESSEGLINKSDFVPTSMESFKNRNTIAIQGTVYNLEKMKSPDNKANLKATIHVDRVIKGDSSLKGQNIYTAVDGGITTMNRFYKNMNQTREADHEILVKYQEAPIPKIGSKVIVGMMPVGTVDDLDPENNNSVSVKKSNNFKLAKTYNLTDIQYGMWVKDTKDKKYRLNNPQALTKLSNNPDAKQGLEELTKELNQKLNK